ncbi:MAG: hypothetical protein EOO01_37145 [Chitinophagaceae bacterium]|nr:MAG: hypothetical protein EOO01_37145 [Chitinophagaceae bacterium]
MKADTIPMNIYKDGKEQPLLCLGTFHCHSYMEPDPNIEWAFMHGGISDALLALDYVYYFLIVEGITEVMPDISKTVRKNFIENSEAIGSMLRKWFESAGFLNHKFPFFMAEGWYDEFEEAEEDESKNVHYRNDNIGVQIFFHEPTFITEFLLFFDIREKLFNLNTFAYFFIDIFGIVLIDQQCVLGIIG